MKWLFDTLKSIWGSLGDELITRGWFGRNPAPGPGISETLIDARQEHTTINVMDRSDALTRGWDFPKEPSREREGPEIER